MEKPVKTVCLSGEGLVFPRRERCLFLLQAKQNRSAFVVAGEPADRLRGGKCSVLCPWT